MSVIVKGMEMPRMCAECDFMGGLLMNEGIYTCDCPVDTICGMNISEEIEKDCRHPDCPLIALPDTHGRLVDADAIVNAMNDMNVGGEVFVTAVEYVKLIMNDADTIVEAEGES